MARGVAPPVPNEKATQQIENTQVQQVHHEKVEITEQEIMARGAAPPCNNKQLEQVRPSPQAADQLPPVKRIVFLAEKTYTGIEPQMIPPLETTLANMSRTETWDIPTPRFKQWTADEAGLEFTLGITIACMPPNFVFGPYNYEQERVEMVRCVTADLVQVRGFHDRR